MNRVRELRQKQGRTIAELALRLGVTESTLRNWERDRHLPKSAVMRRKVARVLGVTEEELALGATAATQPRPLAAAVIPRGDTVLLTQRRFADHGEVWSWPSAKVEDGETPEDAILRQLREELLIDDATVLRNLGDLDLPSGYRMSHYVVSIPDTTEPVINDYEQLQRAEWMTAAQAEEAFRGLDTPIAAEALRVLGNALAADSAPEALKRRRASTKRPT